MLNEVCGEVAGRNCGNHPTRIPEISGCRGSADSYFPLPPSPPPPSVDPRTPVILAFAVAANAAARTRRRKPTPGIYFPTLSRVGLAIRHRADGQRRRRRRCVLMPRDLHRTGFPCKEAFKFEIEIEIEIADSISQPGIYLRTSEITSRNRNLRCRRIRSV